MAYCAVAGVVAGGWQGVINDLAEKKKSSSFTANLVPDPGNKYDPNAVKVIIDGQQVGFIPMKTSPGQARPPADMTECQAKIVGGPWADSHAPDRPVGLRLFWNP